MGFHGRAATHKPTITMRNAKRRLEDCKASPSGSPTDESEFGQCQVNATCPNVDSPALNDTTIGMNWNADCKPGLITPPQCPTSLMLVADWKHVPAAMFQHLVESLPRRMEAVVAAKGATNSI